MINVVANIFFVLLITNIVLCENDCIPYNQLVRENLKDIASDYLLSSDGSITEDNFTSLYRMHETQFYEKKLYFFLNLKVL